MGTDRVGYERVHGGQGFRAQNNTRVYILDFAFIVNTFYKKRGSLVTFRSDISQIVYFLVFIPNKL